MSSKGAVIVTRVSGKESAKYGTSLETQLRDARIKAAEIGCRIIAEYEDAGISGASLKLRSGMQAAIEDIRAGRADVLITYSIDRYSRNEEHQHRIKREVEIAGGRLVFCDIEFDGSPESDFTFTVLGGQAAYERKRIRKRVMEGRRAHAERGLQPCCTRPPFGYHIPSKRDVMEGRFPLDQLGRYVIIEEKAAVVRRIFEMYRDGSSLYHICAALNSDGVSTPKNAEFWNPTTVRGILGNAVYKGEGAYGKWRWQQDETRLDQVDPRTGRPFKSVLFRRPVEHDEWTIIPAPGIVDPVIWAQAQVALEDNKRRGGNPAKVRMLSQVLRCRECKGKMRMTNKQGLYTCARRAQCVASGVTPDCSCAHYSAKFLEGSLLLAIEKASKEREWMLSAIAGLASADQPEISVSSIDIDTINKSLDELRRKEEALVQAQVAGIMAGAPATAYDQAFAEVAKKRKQLQNRLGSVESAVSGHSRSSLGLMSAGDAIDLFLEVLRSPAVTNAEKRDIVLKMIDYIEASAEEVTICFKKGVWERDLTVCLTVCKCTDGSQEFRVSTGRGAFE